MGTDVVQISPSHSCLSVLWLEEIADAWQDTVGGKDGGWGGGLAVVAHNIICFVEGGSQGHSER